MTYELRQALHALRKVEGVSDGSTIEWRNGDECHHFRLTQTDFVPTPVWIEVIA